MSMKVPKIEVQGCVHLCVCPKRKHHLFMSKCGTEYVYVEYHHVYASVSPHMHKYIARCLLPSRGAWAAGG